MTIPKIILIERSGGGTVPVSIAWGDITGTLTDQTDLVDYIAAASIGAANYTRLVVTGSIAAGTTLNVTTSGTGYTHTGAAGDLEISEVLFLSNSIIRIVASGVETDKPTEVTWVNSQSFQFNDLSLDPGDIITIYS